MEEEKIILLNNPPDDTKEFVVSLDEALKILGDEYKKYSEKEIKELILKYTLLVSKIVENLYSKSDNNGQKKIS